MNTCFDNNNIDKITQWVCIKGAVTLLNNVLENNVKKKKKKNESMNLILCKIWLVTISATLFIV